MDAKRKATLVYWRRIGAPAFPAERIDDVEVLTPAEYEAEYGGSPAVGVYDGSWHALTGDSDSIEESLGLCGDLTEIHLLCDAMNISGAIHRHLGLTLAARRTGRA